jgi:hypothetical protein
VLADEGGARLPLVLGVGVLGHRRLVALAERRELLLLVRQQRLDLGHMDHAPARQREALLLDARQVEEAPVLDETRVA